MSHPDDWRGAPDPASLFLVIWAYVRGVSATRLARNDPPPPELHGDLLDALRQSNGRDAVAAFCDALAKDWRSGTDFVSKRARVSATLLALRTLDDILMAIHPRSVRPSLAQVTHWPDWLADVEERRTLTGAYASDGALSLIAKGPLMRCPRLPPDQATFSLGDQFAALKVVDLDSFREDDRRLEVTVRVIDQSVDAGVPHRRERKASEVVTFVPLAEAGADLRPEVIRDGGTVYLDVLKGAKYDPSAALLKAVAANPDSDILIAPELAVDDQDLETVAQSLPTLGGSAARLIIAGSGLTADGPVEEGRPFNRAAALNANGRLLWEHRKVSAYAMHEETAKGLEIPGVDGAVKLMERITWSDAVDIADLDGLGRCLMLICQDLQMSVVDQLLDAFRPDWVLVPILDTGTSLNRWPARRARDLATRGETRFVVVSSLAMNNWRSVPFTGQEMGVAIGPTYLNKGETGEIAAVQAEVAPETESWRFGSVRWRNAKGWASYSRGS
ncbi:hypothetical protein [Brevundimonas sp.]|uniref:hypothetical protein n=1 Tax=Brevundimonas sp. TaxID=1871086 RepID=UPI0035B13D34